MDHDLIRGYRKLSPLTLLPRFPPGFPNRLVERIFPFQWQPSQGSLGRRENLGSESCSLSKNNWLQLLELGKTLQIIPTRAVQRVMIVFVLLAFLKITRLPFWHFDG